MQFKTIKSNEVLKIGEAVGELSNDVRFDRVEFCFTNLDTIRFIGKEKVLNLFVDHSIKSNTSYSLIVDDNFIKRYKGSVK